MYFRDYIKCVRFYFSLSSPMFYALHRHCFHSYVTICVFLLYILIIAVFPLRDGGWNSVANGVFFPVCSILPRTIAVYCENQKTLSNFVYAMLFRPLIVFRKMLLFAFCSHWEWYRQPNTVLLLFYAVCIPYISAPVMFPNCFAACPCFAVVAATPRSPPNAIATMFHQFLTNSNVGLQMWDYNTCCAKHNHHWQAIKNAAQKKQRQRRMFL